MKNDASEVLRLRKELIHQRNLTVDLQEELEEKNNLYIKAIQDRDMYREKLNNVKDSVQRVEQIVQSKVNVLLQQERQELDRLRKENDLLRQRVEIFNQEKLSSQQREKTQQDKIQALTQDLAFYARTVDVRECMVKIDELRAEKNAKDQEITKYLQEINKKSNELENALAENRNLRNLTNVPENYGINIEQIKFLDREKIDDYKKLIRVLQEDNYRLEEERAKLKFMLKQQSMMYKNDQPNQRYRNLSQDQIYKLDEYAMKLSKGLTDDPADCYELRQENKILKAQLEILNTKGFDFAKAQIEAFLKELGLGESGKFMQQLMSGNDDMKKMLKQLLDKGYFTGGAGTSQTVSISGNTFGDLGDFKPPLPTVGVDGDIQSGFSFKFRSYLEVMDKDGRAGLKDPTKHDVAFMQLQLCEFIELIKRKDDELIVKNNEIEHLYEKIRDYLLVQDQLYKDYVKMEKDFSKRKEELEKQLGVTRDSLYQEQHKVDILSKALQTLEKNDAAAIQNRLIELTKQNAILDINLLRMTRKYQILEEQEQLIRREYHNKEADMAEKDRFVQLRINKLKEYKARAIQQLKFLFNKLRLAVPLTEYQAIQSQNEVLKQKNADYIDRNAQMALKISTIQKQSREFQESEERLKILSEAKDDLENEYEIMRKRLELVDDSYRWENAVFNKIVASLKRFKVSPQQAFETFDQDKNGKLDRNEFMKGLEILHLQDLTPQELDVLMNSIDYDGSGNINYKEFVRKLSRHGVKSRSKEEQIIYLIVDSLKRSGINSLAEAFELFDKEKSGTLSREDFKDVFSSIDLKIDPAEIDKFIDNFWKDKKAGIDYLEFLRIFSRYKIRMDESDASKNVAYDRIPDDVLRLKKQIYMKIHDVLQSSGRVLQNLFSKVDVDNSGEIDFDEMREMFEMMKVKLSVAQARNIYNSIDFDQSGKVSFPEFVADFNRTVQTDITTLLFKEKERYEAEKATQSLSMGGMGHATGMSEADRKLYASQQLKGFTAKNMELQLTTRINLLETREKQLNVKLNSAFTILNHAQQSQMECQKQYDVLEKKWNDLTERYLKEKEHIIKLEEELKLSVPKDKASKLIAQVEELTTDCIETKAAMITYKNMTEVIADQARGLKLAMERKKDENENLVNAFREMASQSEEQKRMAKLYYLVMLSRWQEAAVNKKYDMILTENRDLRKELMNWQQMLNNKEYEHHDAENVIQEKLLEIEKLKANIVDNSNTFLTLEKAEFYDKVIQEVSEAKSELEEQYFSIRTKYRTNQLTMDEALAKAEYAMEQLEFLQKNNNTEISRRMIELSGKLQNIRLGEMRSTREAQEKKEENTYLSRLLRQQNDNVRKLEERVAEIESKMHKQEEQFRKADNERMKKFFYAARFDNIGGAVGGRLESEGSLSGLQSSRKFNQTGGFRDKQGAMSKSPHSQMDGSGKMKFTGIERAYTEQEMYQEPEYIKRQQSLQNIQNDPKYVEGKVKRLEQELTNALEEIKDKDSMIKKLRDWQVSDKYLTEDEVFKDIIERQRGKSKEVHEQEAQEMAEAAAQMVKSLQEMLNQKNDQLKSKDEIMQKMRDQMMRQRELDGQEISRLQNQLSLAAGTTLNKLQQIVLQQENNPYQQYGGGKRYDQLTREELSKALDQKDEIITKLQSELKGTEKQLIYAKEQVQTLRDQADQLEADLRHERQQTELKLKVRELDKIKTELKKKDQMLSNLSKTIDELRDKLTDYGASKLNDDQDKKMLQINENKTISDLKLQVEKLRNKNSLHETSKTQLQKEIKDLTLVKLQNQEMMNNLMKDKDELQRALAKTREQHQNDNKTKEKALIQLNQLNSQIKITTGMGGTGGPTYDQLLVKIKELESDNIILNCSQKTVVVYNKETGCFEYIGFPIYLNNERELADIEEFLASLRAWLNRQGNDRLTLKSIFQSMDKENFGELSEARFLQAMEKIGIKLRATEVRMIKEVLDPRGIGFFRYRPLVRELQGIPQLDFCSKEVFKLAKLIEARDLTQQDFKKLIDPTRSESMNLTQFQEQFKQINNDVFSMSNEELEQLFKYVTKSLRTIGVVMSIERLTEKVFIAVDAYLIERSKDAISKSMRSFQELFSRHCSKQNNFLDYSELENLLLECQLALKPNLFERLLNLLDPGKKQSKVSHASLKFMLSGEASAHEARNSFTQRSYDYEPSLDKGAQLSEESSLEELNICRNAARKILQHFSSLPATGKSLQDLFNQKDRFNEGLISREDAENIIKEARINDLSAGELKGLMKKIDRNNRGYINTHSFLEKLVDLTQETKQEQCLRQFALNTKRQGIVLKQELLKYDTTRSGRLDKKTFAKALNQLPVTVNEESIDMLFQAGESQSYIGTLDVKDFTEKISRALNAKPLANFQQLNQPKSTSASKVGKDGKSQGSQEAFANWETEKKFKTKLAALQQQIEESKKELQGAEKQSKHWQEVANKLEREKNGLQARLVDLNAKPPKAAQEESNAMAQVETVQQLKDQVFYLQDENSKLEKNIQIELKAEIGKLQRENEKLIERVRHFQEEARRMEYQVNRLIGKPMDATEKREEGELWREKKILDLEKEIQEAEKREHDLQEQLFKVEEKVLDLKFQKETFDLQYARLQKRITDLEQYKLASSKYSAVLRNKEDEEVKHIEENSNTLSNLTGVQPGSKKAQDTVKLRSKSSKSVAELEMLVESLKRVIEKQKSENDALKKHVDSSDKHQDKLKSEKQLRQKIESLEQEVHSYEMRDVNMSEKEKTVKKLIEANRQLREDLKKEADRYGLLEGKYKDVLVKYNILAKEHAKNTEMLFTMNTGGNLNNYDSFLERENVFSHSNNGKQGGRSVQFAAGSKERSGSKKKIDELMQYDREFQDAF